MTAGERILKSFAFARFSTGKVIYQISSSSNDEKQQKKEAEKTISKLIEYKLNPKERQKVNSSFGNWFTIRDEKDIIYLVLTSPDYAERNAYGLITGLREELEKLGDYSNEDDVSLKFHVKDSMNVLFKKYSNTADFDKLEQGLGEVEKVRVTMNKNITNMLDNTANLKKVEDKAATLNKNSKAFVKQAKDLERIMFWRKVKLNIIIFLIFAAVGCYFIIPFVLESTALKAAKPKSDSSSSDSSSKPKPAEPSTEVKKQLIIEQSMANKIIKSYEVIDLQTIQQLDQQAKQTQQTFQNNQELFRKQKGFLSQTE